MFIVFEGGEGSGKTTQLKLLQDHLKKKGIDPVITREPGGTSFSEDIRELIFSKGKDIDHETQLLLFMAARRDHLKEVVLPALQENKWVVCDRYIMSTMVYQGHVFGISPSLILDLHRDFCFNLFPQLTFVFDIPFSQSQERLSRRKNKNFLDDGDQAFHESIFDNFLKEAQNPHHNACIIDASLSMEEVYCQILDILSEKGYLE